MTTVLLLSPTGAPGGAERALVGLARQLSALGFTVRAVLLADGPLPGWLEKAGCPVTVCQAGRTRDLRRTGGTIRQLVKLASTADVVISNQTKGHVYGGIAARLAGVPEIWWQHGSPTRSRIELVGAVVPGTVIVCSSEVAAIGQRRLTPGRRLDIVHPGIPVEQVRGYRGSGRDVRQRHGWEGHTVAGIVGRLQPWKGQAVFLRAAAQVAATHPEARFAVIGGAVLGWEGDYPQRLRALAEELGIGPRTLFVGHQDDVYPWFDALDVVVHASVGEPFGLVLLEAMALGKPLIATVGPGPLEILEDGVSGILVPPGDSGQLAAAIDRLFTDPELARSLGEAGATRSEAFSEQAMGSRFAALLHEIVRADAAGSSSDRAHVIPDG
jgi:glycosyltransferase involved in cell wall biosynthesis